LLKKDDLHVENYVKMVTIKFISGKNCVKLKSSSSSFYLFIKTIS